MSDFKRKLLGLVLLPSTVVAAAGTAADYRPPRLANGQPDLQGTWDHRNATPLERPSEIDTLVITQAQAIAIERKIYDRKFDPTRPAPAPEFFPEERILPIRGSLRSSVIIDPEDGRLPGTAAFDRDIVTLRPAWMNSAFDGPEQRDGSERCLGNPASQPPILHSPGNNMHQIVQTDTAVLFFSESMHDARIIRLNAQHVPAAMTSWLGDSIGWWEGDTLVVETTYFSPSDRGRRLTDLAFLISPRTLVTERFTLESFDELNYVFTVSDSTYYKQPWKGETHFQRTSDRMLEYACHEGNYSMRFMLQNGRALDAASSKSE
jgi:hypothetical protein